MSLRSFQKFPVCERTERKRVSDVLKSFNTWRFKREQPSDVKLLEEFVGRAVIAGSQISFVLYWGKGMRSRAGANERNCLDFLSDMGSRIQRVYGPGARFEILFTDTHANLNGHDGDEIEDYLESLRSAASDRFDIWRLSDIVACSPVGDSMLLSQTVVDADEMISRLVGCAEKWYRGNGEARDGAARYFWMNMKERIAVQIMFPNSIFITFNGSELRDIFPPSLPIFYMYSVKKGTSVKPWFMDEPGILAKSQAPTGTSDGWM
jgi:L-tyrosine isonitrile synthase